MLGISRFVQAVISCAKHRLADETVACHDVLAQRMQLNVSFPALYFEFKYCTTHQLKQISLLAHIKESCHL